MLTELFISFYGCYKVKKSKLGGVFIMYKKTNSDMTIVIKTFQRRNSLWNLLNSIREYYPDVRILIVDDSLIKYRNSTLKKFKTMYINYICLKFDSGISEGRNVLLDNIKTPFFLYCDDDFEFSDATNIYKLVNLIEDNYLDILGADIYEYHKLNSLLAIILALKNKRIHKIINDDTYTLLGRYLASYTNNISEGLIINKIPESIDQNESIITTNQVNMFFAARTESIRKIGGWDGRLKFYSEDLFWFNCFYNNLKIGFTSSVSIKSLRYLPLSYVPFRFRPKKKI